MGDHFLVDPPLLDSPFCGSFTASQGISIITVSIRKGNGKKEQDKGESRWKRKRYVHAIASEAPIGKSTVCVRCEWN